MILLTSFSLSAESITLFTRVRGGICSKAADVRVNLVGKVEVGIPDAYYQSTLLSITIGPVSVNTRNTKDWGHH